MAVRQPDYVRAMAAAVGSLAAFERRHQGYTVDDAAARAGLDRDLVRRVETGDPDVPYAAVLAVLAHSVGLRVSTAHRAAEQTLINRGVLSPAGVPALEALPRPCAHPQPHVIVWCARCRTVIAEGTRPQERRT
jgi:transcriptional regulator with XRE-family HTH domain